MNYRPGFEKKSKFRRIGSVVGTGAVVVALFIFFIIAVTWFRAPKESPKNKVDSIVDVLTPMPVSESVILGAIDTVSREATLIKVDSGEDVGTAKRGTKDDNYYFEIKSVLPEIDREVNFYEVWLLRDVPYSYFSAGEMITNDDGEFVIEWSGENEKQYNDFTHVIVTLQEYGGTTDPGSHILEGEFGK
jgi:hypothetical protein